MIEFSLSRKKERLFPEYVTDEHGECFPVNANFRTVLKILRLFGDNNVQDLHKAAWALEWFYRDKEPEDGLELMLEFINGPKKDAGSEPAPAPAFCCEFDAEEIYVSFLKEYKLDLVSVKFLHWYKFRLLLANLSPESPFYRKINLRFMDLKGHTGEQYSKLSRAKRLVQLPQRLSREEERALNEMRGKLRRSPLRSNG
jgi:hypothetical protein